MKYIHTEDDLKPFAGFVHRPEEPGYSFIICGDSETYGRERTGTDLNQLVSRRVSFSLHKWPPGKAHGMHHHKTWEQCYYIFAGQAQITVGDEKMVVGPGGSAYMPPNVDHDIVAVGNETLIAGVITCPLTEDELE